VLFATLTGHPTLVATILLSADTKDVRPYGLPLKDGR
jgi:hypothetical protein